MAVRKVTLRKQISCIESLEEAEAVKKFVHTHYLKLIIQLDAITISIPGYTWHTRCSPG